MKGKVGFQPGNKLGERRIGMKYAKNQAWENLGGKFVGDFTGKVTDILNRLASDKPVSAFEMKFLEEFKDLLEYFKPKLSRSEVDQKITGNMTINDVCKMLNDKRNAHLAERSGKQRVEVENTILDRE